jgi:hypothetical protein
MKGIQNKKICISETNYTYLLYVIFHAWLMGICQLVTFVELSNNVGTTGTGSMGVVASRVAIS